MLNPPTSQLDPKTDYSISGNIDVFAANRKQFRSFSTRPEVFLPENVNGKTDYSISGNIDVLLKTGSNSAVFQPGQKFFFRKM